MGTDRTHNMIKTAVFNSYILRNVIDFRIQRFITTEMLFCQNIDLDTLKPRVSGYRPVGVMKAAVPDRQPVYTGCFHQMAVFRIAQLCVLQRDILCVCNLDSCGILQRSQLPPLIVIFW